MSYSWPLCVLADRKVRPLDKRYTGRAREAVESRARPRTEVSMQSLGEALSNDALQIRKADGIPLQPIRAAGPSPTTTLTGGRDGLHAADE